MDSTSHSATTTSIAIPIRQLSYNSLYRLAVLREPFSNPHMNDYEKFCLVGSEQRIAAMKTRQCGGGACTNYQGAVVPNGVRGTTMLHILIFFTTYKILYLLLSSSKHQQLA